MTPRSPDTRSSTRLAIAGIAMCAACSSDGTGTVTPAAIRFATQPPTAVAGEPFAVTVELVDGNGDRLTGGRAYVTLDVDGDAVLSGATTIASSLGVASFSDLVVTRAGAGYRIDAVASGREVTSAPFDVLAGPAHAAASAVAPQTVQWFEGTPIEVVFTFMDAYGNAVGGVPVSLTSSLSGTFNPETGSTTSSGTFATIFTPTTAGSATFGATVDGRFVSLETPLVVTQFCPTTLLPIPGVATGTLPSGTCDWNGRAAAVYRFSANQIGAVALTTNAAFAPRVEVKTGIFATNPQFLPIPSSPTVEWLLTPGTYLFRIGAQTGSGAYSIQATANQGTSGVATRAIITSGTFAQSLLIGDREFGDDTVYDHFLLFDQTRACTITMRSTEFDAYLWAEDVLFQEFIALDDNGAGGTDARVIITPCQVEGRPIGILANSSVVGFGAYTLTVQFDDPPGAVPTTAAASVFPLDSRAIRPADVPVVPPGSRVTRR